MTFILRYWPQLLGAVVVLVVVLWINRLGYESGYNASQAEWLPRLAAANKALQAANERTRMLEESSKSLSDRIEKQHAETIASLNSRAADADVRIRGLVRQLSRHSRCGELPALPGAAAVADDSSASAERAERAGGVIADVGRRCEADAATLTALQQWVREQQVIR